MTASEIARRILTHDARPIGDQSPEAASLALQQACARVTESLRDSMGEAGCTALLARALARAEEAHPMLKDIGRPDGDSVRLNRVAENVDAHGIENVTVAIEALLTALADILIRIIGEDMTKRLMDHDRPRAGSRNGGRAP